jgi:hypothetical protein
MEDKTMKTISKKIIGGLFAGMIIVSIGAVFAHAQTNTTTDGTTPERPISIGGRHNRNGPDMFGFNLTEEQHTELQELIVSLKDQNATPQEIQTAIQQKLDEYGVLDKQLDKEIQQIEQRLAILDRQKDLRNEGYSWTEIQTMIQNEFGLQNTTGINADMMFGHGFEKGFCGGPRGEPSDFRPYENSDQ